MFIVRQKMIYREDLQANPRMLYIFGDNLQRIGYGGQAAEMRGEPNAFGIATKRTCGHLPQDYFYDTEGDVKAVLRSEFARLEETLKEELEVDKPDYFKYIGVVIPLDGIGTGLSRMPEFAPKMLAFIEKRFEQLQFTREDI